MKELAICDTCHLFETWQQPNLSSSATMINPELLTICFVVLLSTNFILVQCQDPTSGGMQVG
jgi:hypothetical protein